MNTAIAGANDPVLMAEAMRLGVEPAASRSSRAASRASSTRPRRARSRACSNSLVRALPFDPPLYPITDRRRFGGTANDDGFGPDEVARFDGDRHRRSGGSAAAREGPRRSCAVCAPSRAGRAAASGVKLLVNRRADVALAASADGVHLPESGLPRRVARASIGPDRLVGCSVHAADLAARAGADFRALRPGQDAGEARLRCATELERLAAVARTSTVPVLAVGGVTPERVSDVLRARGVGSRGDRRDLDARSRHRGGGVPRTLARG